MSTSRRATACISFSRPGRLSRPLAPLMPWSLIDGRHFPSVALCNGLQFALLVAGRLAVRSAGPNVQGDPLGHSSFRVHGMRSRDNTRIAVPQTADFGTSKSAPNKLDILEVFGLKTERFLEQRPAIYCPGSAAWSLVYNAGGDQAPVELVTGLEPFPQRRLISLQAPAGPV